MGWAFSGFGFAVEGGVGFGVVVEGGVTVLPSGETTRGFRTGAAVPAAVPLPAVDPVPPVDPGVCPAVPVPARGLGFVAGVAGSVPSVG